MEACSTDFRQRLGSGSAAAEDTPARPLRPCPPASSIFVTPCEILCCLFLLFPDQQSIRRCRPGPHDLCCSTEPLARLGIRSGRSYAGACSWRQGAAPCFGNRLRLRWRRACHSRCERHSAASTSRLLHANFRVTVSAASVDLPKGS